jgi:tRNA pseudouridine13 synthase
MQPSGRALALEQEVLSRYAHWVDGLCAARVKGDRRRLILGVSNLQWHVGDQTLELSFTLPSGCFATAVLRELLTYTEAQRRHKEG